MCMSNNRVKNILVISAPSGGGKSVIARALMEKYPQLQLSVSSTTRSVRAGEIDGVHYNFISKEKFLERIQQDAFVEYEEIFGNYYGTEKSEIERIRSNNGIVLFDIDVKGAYNIKKAYPDNSFLLFLAPPSIEVLRERLSKRGTETEEQINKRIARAEMEIEMSKNFDYVIVNDVLDVTKIMVLEIFEKMFIPSKEIRI